MKERYSRREFLGQLTAATAAVAAAGPLTAAAARGRATKRVIVVGAGIAGLCAAYELTALGHDVTVLEAQHMPGEFVATSRPGPGESSLSPAISPSALVWELRMVSGGS